MTIKEAKSFIRKSGTKCFVYATYNEHNGQWFETPKQGVVGLMNTLTDEDVQDWEIDPNGMDLMITSYR